MHNQSLSKNLSNKIPVLISILALVVVVGLFVKIRLLDNKLNQTTASLNKAKADSEFQTQLLYNEIDYQKSLLRPAVSLKENLVVFPELKVALPYNEITKTLQYSTDNRAEVGSSITSALLYDHQIRQMGCSGLVRVNFKDGTPFSPWEELAGSVKLSDGRTLYIVAAKAFKNKQASTEACATEVWRQVNPKQVADEFKKAQAY